ncbi:UTP--glucose-1-phosphate uridylyltransferase GalU [Bacillus sp. CGMCC 1.16607]|uniref:UTP--glucose-1-phosphate uridylyltransferase GalU n=1 Tax=Bacillus sp. CGMCC 1.16607 TaxID=3351842 RepID=UPI003642A0DC
MSRIKKAIIPAAGLGTRFLPATKALPKEMLPIIDKPTIQFIIEEAIYSGIEDIIIITGRNKRSIEDHFDVSVELELNLKNNRKNDLLEKVKSISNMADIHYIRQKEPLGLGHAIYCARKFIGNEPFAVLLGDDIISSNKPCIKQLMEVYDKVGSSVLGVKTIENELLYKYGVIDPIQTLYDEYILIKGMVEKPIVSPPSNLAVMGRYILDPLIFDFLKDLEPGVGGEIQLTDAICQLARVKQVIAFPFEGKRYDVGDKLGFLKATVEFALERKEIREEFLQYLRYLLDYEINQ